MTNHTKAYREGYNKGVEDKANQYAPRVDHLIKRWAKDFEEFEHGYNDGHNKRLS